MNETYNLIDIAEEKAHMIEFLEKNTNWLNDKPRNVMWEEKEKVEIKKKKYLRNMEEKKILKMCHASK